MPDSPEFRVSISQKSDLWWVQKTPDFQFSLLFLLSMSERRTEPEVSYTSFWFVPPPSFFFSKSFFLSVQFDQTMQISYKLCRKFYLQFPWGMKWLNAKHWFTKSWSFAKEDNEVLVRLSEWELTGTLLVTTLVPLGFWKQFLWSLDLTFTTRNSDIRLGRNRQMLWPAVCGKEDILSQVACDDWSHQN